MEFSQKKQSIVAIRYAKALFQHVVEAKKLKEAESNLAIIENEWLNTPEFITFISSPLVSKEAQEKAIIALAKAYKLAPYITNFLALLASARRLNKLEEITLAFRKLLMQEKGIGEAHLYVAQDIDKTYLTKMSALLKANYDKEYNVVMHEDPSLIGGFVLIKNSHMYDCSVKTKLQQLKLKLKEA